MGKKDNIQEDEDYKQRQGNSKNQKVMLETNNSETKMKNALVDSFVDCILAKKE